MLPNLTALRAFEAAARHQSFSKTANALGVTPAAISRAIRRLEDDLGFDLFDRSHRAVSLTEAGTRYAQRVTEGFRHLTTEKAEQTPGRPTVTLDVEATFLRQWILPRLCEDSFRDLQLSLNIRTHHDPPRVISPTADMAIVWGFADYWGFKRQRLVSPRTILVSTPSLGISTLAEAAGGTLIHEADDHWWRLVFSEAGLPYPDATPTITLNRCDLPVEAARLGLGMAVADDVIAEYELKTGALVGVDGPRLDSQDYFLMSRSNVSVPAQAFAGWLKDQAHDFADWQKSL
ncbi:LysR family transcriptional regulator [Litoreibacter roseus]|uniref:LysR family transcriptional regulator n=1 Tax=Litoreibacter roseus TaxID=2601869 RepID=A0A6N6JI74_9RHOB|nr:LysR family transcriptional regulator [Litoreibacter roseus]GFE66063.1 LysR family transcriptional regulator [Litoreibacter roseus]